MDIRLPPNTPVLVTGASGFTGTRLLNRLVAQGARVRAIARQSSDLSPFAQLKVDWIRGEVYDPEVVARAVKDVEYVFHLAAAYRQAGISDLTYRQVHVESTKLLAKELTRRAGFKRLVHLSTVGVHGHIDDPPADENYRFAPGDEYQRTKLEAEQWLHLFAAENGLDYTVIRPAAIYGPADRRLLKLFRLAAWPIVPILGYGKCLYHLIHVDDLCSAILLAATHPAARAQAFIVGDPEPMALPEMIKVIASELGSAPRIVHIPSAPVFIAADICEWICRKLSVEPPLYRRRVAFFTKDRSFNTAKLRTQLGFEYGVSTEQGVRETARWYVKHGWLRGRHKRSDDAVTVMPEHNSSEVR